MARARNLPTSPRLKAEVRGAHRANTASEDQSARMMPYTKMRASLVFSLLERYLHGRAETDIQLAHRLLVRNGIDPNALSQTQLQQFSKQNPGDQTASMVKLCLNPKGSVNFECRGSDVVEEANDNQPASVAAPGQRERDDRDLWQADLLLELVGVDCRSLTRSQAEAFLTLALTGKKTVLSTYIRIVQHKRRQQVGKEEMAGGDILHEEDVHQSDSMDESRDIRQARVLLSENGIDPNNLSQDQLQQFSRQIPFVQAMSIDNLNRPEDFEGHDIVPSQLWARPYPIPRIERATFTDTSGPRIS
ncbi:uncharacterized protein DNG_09014 [Cephalotrichum gorgonifer]|uniref:Uncharacterized protein n=1 Tax=Cephalotrichum gorgonifer TaxID=2041049 RepID=A0AAE8N7Q8_9PEZI|nr:uncharacterized protein DNG_09014 [Cephalotrichum gorgonifer]